MQCSYCSDEIMQGDYYVELDGDIRCEDEECRQKAYRQAATLTDYKNYCLAYFADFIDWLETDGLLFSAIDRNEPIRAEDKRGAYINGPALYQVFAEQDWNHYCQWYRKIASEHVRICQP